MLDYFYLVSAISDFVYDAFLARDKELAEDAKNQIMDDFGMKSDHKNTWGPKIQPGQGRRQASVAGGWPALLVFAQTSRRPGVSKSTPSATMESSIKPGGTCRFDGLSLIPKNPVSMKQALNATYRSLRLLILASACRALPALADDYADVAQLVRTSQFSQAMTRVDSYLATQPGDPQMQPKRSSCAIRAKPHKP